jgi:hypothetical protein
METTCKTEACNRSAWARGLCGTCYARWRSRQPLPLRPLVEDRFWAKVDKGGPDPTHRPGLGPCWLWTAKTDRAGYGRFRLDGKTPTAHCVAYEMVVGPIPPGLQLDHLCRVTGCVRPAHMDPCTAAENTRRARALVPWATECGNGHPWTEDSTFWWVNTTGLRVRTCRICHAASERRRRQRLRQ